VKKVGEIVDKHPEEALSIVRSWMYQDGRAT
jgi:flagellar M-ring protein FliF